MFLLASDFDRTFYINNYDFKKNVEALKIFRENNKFVIVTGRSYQDYMNITKNYVPLDYLVINHGATILKDNKVIRSEYINTTTIDKLKNIIDFENIDYFATSDTESRVNINHGNISKINIAMKDNLVAKKQWIILIIILMILKLIYYFIRISLKLYQVRRISATH